MILERKHLLAAAILMVAAGQAVAQAKERETKDARATYVGVVVTCVKAAASIAH